jgi:hypothetical protein
MSFKCSHFIFSSIDGEIYVWVLIACYKKSLCFNLTVDKSISEIVLEIMD